MTRRGYHVRKHTRVNQRGTHFLAGQGSAMVMLQRPQPKPQAQQARQGQGLVLDEAAIAKVKKPRVGVQLGEMMMDLSVEHMYDQDKARVRNEPISELWDLEERAAVSKDDAKAGSETAETYQKLNDEGKRKFLIEMLQDELDNWDHQILWEDWFEGLEEEITDLEERNKTDRWDVYALERGKVRKGETVDITDLWESYPKYYYYSLQVFHLGKNGLALKYTYTNNKGTEWFYMLPHYRQKMQTSF